MRALIQRVLSASVTIDGKMVADIGKGVLLLIGIEQGDTEDDLQWMCRKIAALRIFSDAEGKMNLDIRQAQGEILAVSQFTLHASTVKGNRPSFIRAEKPEIAEPMFMHFVKVLQEQSGGVCKTGVFGADMKVALVNDGPVTIMMDSRLRE